MTRRIAPGIFVFFALSVMTSFQGTSQALLPKYEFRGIWVATVNNIDWPSQPGLPVEEQKREAIEILDLHQRLGMNAVIFRPGPVPMRFILPPWNPGQNT